MTTLKDVLQHLMPCYKSIDIGTLAINHDNQFINIATKMTFSMDEPVTNTLPDQKEHGAFRLIKCQLPINEYQRIKTELATNGKLMICNTEIDFLWDLDIENSPNDSFYASSGHGSTWPVFMSHPNTYIGRPDNPRISDPIRNIFATLDINQEYKRVLPDFGYGYIKHLIQNELEIRFEGSPQIDIVVPIYAKITDTKITQERKLNITINYHKDVSSLFLLGWYANDTRGINSGNFSEKIDKSESEKLILEKTITKTISSEDQKELNLYLELRYAEFTNPIYEEYHSVQELLLASKVYPSPLYTALSLFMPDDELLKVIEKPEASKLYKDNGKKKEFERWGASDVFEESVCKLLNAGGMSTIWLNKYEYFIEKNREGQPLGSVDLLSYDSKNRILCVISCKLATPEKNYIDKIDEASQLIKARIDNEICDVRPVLVVNTKPIEAESVAEKADVIVVNSDGLKELFKLVKTRQITVKDFIKEENSALKASRQVMKSWKYHELK